jgi:hypothetical protein
MLETFFLINEKVIVFLPYFKLRSILLALVQASVLSDPSTRRLCWHMAMKTKI